MERQPRRQRQRLGLQRSLHLPQLRSGAWRPRGLQHQRPVEPARAVVAVLLVASPPHPLSSSEPPSLGDACVLVWCVFSLPRADLCFTPPLPLRIQLRRSARRVCVCVGPLFPRER
jgi:hypothetical protein